MLPNFAKLESKIAALELWMAQHGDEISCVQQDLRVLRRGWAYQNGLSPNTTDDRFQPRILTRAPFALEETVTTTRVIGEEEILRGLQNRYSADGFYANIGNDPYRIIITYADGGVVARTVPAGTNYALTSFVNSVQIDSLGGKPAVFQLELR